MPRAPYVDRTLAAQLGLDPDAVATYLDALNIGTTIGTGAAATANTTIQVPRSRSTSSSTSTPALTPSQSSGNNTTGVASLAPRAVTAASTTTSTSSRANGILLTPSGTSTTTSSRGNGVLLTPSGSSVTSSNASSAASDTSSTQTITATHTHTGTASISGRSSVFSDEDIVSFFDTHYGREEKLEAYQKLCAHLDVSPIPNSITQCKKALKTVHINIHDFLQAHQDRTPAPHFETLDALRTDIRSSRDRRFSRSAAKPNPILSWMLIHVYSNSTVTARRQGQAAASTTPTAVPGSTSTDDVPYGGPGPSAWW